MYSDDEEAEIAVDIRCITGQKEPIKPALASVRSKDPSIVATHYDPYRRRLYYGLDDGAVCFWIMTESTPNSNASRFVGAHKGPVSAICTPRPTDGDLGKGGLIVTGSVDSSIKIWDYQGKVMLEPTVCVQTLYGHSGTVTSLVILGDYIISSSTDGSIKMWRHEEGRRQLVYPWFELQATVSGMEGWVRGLSHDSSGDVGDLGALYAADESGGITRIVPEALWDDSIQRLSTRMDFRVNRRVEHLHDRSVSIIRFVAKWDLVLTVAFDLCIRAWDVKTESVRHCWANERQCQFTTLEVNLEFDEILAGDTSGVLSIFSIRTGRLMVTKHMVQPATAAGSKRGVGASAASTAASGGSSSSIQSVVSVLGRQLYAVTTARELGLWIIDHELDYNVARGGHEKAVISLYTCSGGVAGPGADLDYRIFSASVDNTVRLWDPYDMGCIRVMEEATSEISAMTFFEGWNLLVTGHDNGNIRLWNLDTGHATTLKDKHTNAVTALSLALVHRNEELLISASYDGWVVLWDIRSLRGEPPHMVAKFRAHGPEAPSGSRVPGSGTGDSGSPTPQRSSLTGIVAGAAAAAAAGEPRPCTDALRVALASPEPEILALKYDPLKKAIVTAGTEGIIKVWAATGYDYLGCHRGHKNAVTCLALDANFLFSGSDDCTICLWDTVPAAVNKPHFAALKGTFSTRPLKVLEAHRRSVTGLDVLPASGHLVSCSLDGQLLVWDYVAGQVRHRFAHDTEEFRCLALRYDRPEVLVGTLQANILRYTIHEQAVAAAGFGRRPSKGHARQTVDSVQGLHGVVEGLTLNSTNENGVG
ncbi:hypothetical protein VOLCADRAFT_99881 [Volvox carteri f. nagariensis]|uniref:Uncharacterized protein n=1 Tax=Volvox carteri f. nagariensis TaxID=3068 RepID=D8UIV9_VOLCA|nr:uncharacterized protein VOLCADRAFT_99881 [Volvox carteri f. nagariensis]EFJ40323.1 hypothetical protein VOLCADRAFT_99881 [Volvox carteri f. nagariensis]|eukprot:XP_002958586.1 hypothetical protein VOLCADRAFT_99881 [Volvox carteri f. nagariensis]